MSNCNCNRAPDVCTCGDPGYNNHVCLDPVSAACVMIQGDFTCLGLTGPIITLQDFATAINAWKCNELCNCIIPTGLGVTFSAAGQSTGLYGVKVSWLPASNALSYTLEYKHSTDTDFTIVGNQTTTENTALILPAGSYIFRVKSICQTCTSAYTTYSLTVDACNPPTGLVYNPTTKRLTWAFTPNTNSSAFTLLAGTSPVTVSITESPLNSGNYSADLSNITFLADTLTTFNLTAACNSHVTSNYATGCASVCVVPNQTTPTVSSITGTSAVVTWPTIPNVIGYTVAINGGAAISVGNVNTYTLPNLTAATSYTVTVGYNCSSTPGCYGKSVTFSTTGGCVCPAPTGFAVTFDGRGLADNTFKARTIWNAISGTTPVTYDLLYKLSTAQTWTAVSTGQTATSNSTLLLNSPNSYDFKLIGHCGSCSSSEVLLNNKALVACTAPTNVTWDAVNKKLIWNNTPGQFASSFEIQMRRDDSATFATQAQINIVETPAGTYTADLSAISFAADYVYHFCVSNLCGSSGNVISDHGSGCAFDCVVPNQTAPTVTNITSTGGRVNWNAISGITSYTITIDNGTAINVGNVTHYDITTLMSATAHTVKVGYVCGSGTSCAGKTVTFTTGATTYNCPAPSGLTVTNINVPSPIVTVYIGSGTTAPTTMEQILAGTAIQIASGADIPTNYSGFLTPGIMWMAQPLTEPKKTITFDGSFPEPIGNNQTFQSPYVKGTMAVYASQNPILIQSNPYTFKKIQ